MPLNSLSAFSAPAVWKLETLQDASSLWWQTLTVETVPGVVYRLQKSDSLAEGGWTNIATTHGNGEKWHCPVFSGTAPIAPLPAGAAVLPAQSTGSGRSLFLTLEKTTSGGVLISWSSLDDQTARRELLAGVALDSAWGDFDSGYLNAHGDYLFGVSPRLASPVSFTASASSLGPQDSAMVAALAAALPTMTSNIQNSVANAVNSAPLLENPGSRAFYRFAADWSVDSDGDGRLDWEEIIFDGNNPFAVDSDGDGTPDIAQSGPSTLPSLDGSASLMRTLSTEAATPSPPEARVEMLYSSAAYFRQFAPNHPTYVPPGNASVNGVASPALAEATSFGAFLSAFRGMPLPNDWRRLSSIIVYNLKSAPYMGGGYEHGSYGVWYQDARRFLRLRLDYPAPAGGYSIPKRVQKSLNPSILKA